MAKKPKFVRSDVRGHYFELSVKTLLDTPHLDAVREIVSRALTDLESLGLRPDRKVGMWWDRIPVADAEANHD